MIDVAAVARSVVEHHRSLPSDFQVVEEGEKVVIQSIHDWVRYEFTMAQMEDHVRDIGGNNRSRDVVGEITLDMQESLSQGGARNMPYVLIPGSGFVVSR